MKINIIIRGQVEINPEHYREINDDGKYGPVPSKEEMLKILSNLEYFEPLIDVLYDTVYDHEVISIED